MEQLGLLQQMGGMGGQEAQAPQAQDPTRMGQMAQLFPALQGLADFQAQMQQPGADLRNKKNDIAKQMFSSLFG